MSEARKKMIAASERLRVRNLKEKGYSVSKISKPLSISYKHCKNLFEQELIEEKQNASN